MKTTKNNKYLDIWKIIITYANEGSLQPSLT